MAFSVVLPVKALADAKSRLAAFAGKHRERLALALATDTATAVLGCDAVGQVVVVCDDPVASASLGALGATVVPDLPGGGLNAALRHGAAQAVRLAPAAGVVALTADLPALSPEELERTLKAADGASFVPDISGYGTTLYTVRPGSEFSPRFGPDSAARHRSAGCAALEAGPELRRDVDTPADLREALDLGVGPHTLSIAHHLFS